ncbi:MAG: hypothetical protein NVSMB52_13290 [Chloroflexota bacterium]
MGFLILFAVIGIVSAGVFLADKVGGSSSSHTPRVHATVGASGTNPVTVAQARGQATAIVKSAQDASRSIVSSATKKANKQATAIVAAAHRSAKKIAAAPIPTAVPSAVSIAPTAVPSISQRSVVPVLPVQATTAVTSVPQTQALLGPARIPDLRGVPTSWRVIGFDAKFGSGPGTAGSISVINRGNRVFSGTATVVYVGGGYATAYFSGLAPGQSGVLALNGSPYAGHGYHIVVNAR